MSCVNHAIHNVWIAAACDVVEASAESQVVAEEVEAFFQLDV